MGSRSLGLFRLSAILGTETAIRGFAISLVTLARKTLLDAILVFLSLFLLRILLFSDQTPSNVVRLKIEALQSAQRQSLPAVFPQCPVRDEPFSDARVA